MHLTKENNLEEMVDKRRVGRPPGRKERITLKMSQEHIGYLKSRDVSYSKTIARLIDKEFYSKTIARLIDKELNA